MNIKLLMYNQGIDNKPRNVADINNFTFDGITMNPIKLKEQRIFSCDNSKFITNYNDIITKKLKKFIDDKSVNVCILQEICQENLKDFQFKKYVASYNRYTTQNYSCKKMLVTGSYGDINIELPDFIKNSFSNSDDKIIMDMPHDYCNVTKLSFQNNILYIINLHNRGIASNEKREMFLLHLIGIILSILKNDEHNSNIIMCGDYNAATIFGGLRYDLINESKVLEFIEFIKNANTQEIIYDQIKVGIITDFFALLIKLLNFKQCICNAPEKEIENVTCKNNKCNVKSIRTIREKCDKAISRPNFDLYDIIYYRLCDGCDIELNLDDSLCTFALSTSTHMPYVMTITFQQDGKISGPTSTPSYFNDILNISNKLIKLTSNISPQIKSCNKNRKYNEKYSENENENDKENIPIKFHTGGNNDTNLYDSYNLYRKYMKYKYKYLNRF